MNELEQFVDSCTAGVTPGCCYLCETWDDYDKTARMRLRIDPCTEHECSQSYAPDGSQFKQARRHLESQGWRVFHNQWDWDDYWSKEYLRRPATLKEIEATRVLCSGLDDIEVDNDALISDAREDAGRWVQAWVWVSDADLRGDECAT